MFFKKNLYEDNKSVLKMETNGRNSCSSISRHIDITYLFTKDRVDKKEWSIECCPALLMVANFLQSLCKANYFIYVEM